MTLPARAILVTYVDTRATLKYMWKLPILLNEFFYWRASVASETLTGVTQSKIWDVCLFRYMYGLMYVILYFDPRVFVLVMWSTPSQIALNRILLFIDQYLEIELFTVLNSFSNLKT